MTWDQVVALALELPEVEQATSWGAPCLKVRGKAPKRLAAQVVSEA